MEVMSSCYRALVPYIYFNLNKRVEVPYEICLFLSFFFLDEVFLFPSKYNKKCTTPDNNFDHTSWKSYDSNKI